MALVLDANTTSESTGAESSRTFSHTCASLFKGGLFLVVCLGSGTPFTGTVTATYAGVSMTKVGEVHHAGANDALVALFYLIKPTSGANNVVVSWTGSAVAQCVARSYSGVHQGLPISTGSYTSTTGVATTASIAVPSRGGDIVIDGVSIWSNSAITAGAGQSEILNETFSSHRGGASVEAGDASVTMSWTVPAAVWALAGMSIHPASPGGGAALSPSMIF